jgi:acetoacetyl-CoA synthetase
MAKVTEGDLLWTPSAERVSRAHLTHYLKWLAERGRRFESYRALWQWSIDDQEGFWGSLWEYFGVRASQPLSACWDHAPCRAPSGFPDHA